jgi:hypothetical protein
METKIQNLKELYEKDFEDENHNLAKKYFGRLPTEKDFPQECPYTFEQVMEFEPWV